MDDIIIIDDALPKAKQDELEQLCTNPLYNWSFYSGNVQPEYAGTSFPTTNDSINYPQMVNVLYKDQETISPVFHFFIPLITAIPFTCGHLISVKTNMSNCVAGSTNRQYGIPHTDLPLVNNVITALYYINDSDGDTIIFNERNGFTGTLTEKTRINPKRGRLIVFDGSLLHSGNFPRAHNLRLVTNINMLPYGNLRK